jgi:hypothetical protein
VLAKRHRPSFAEVFAPLFSKSGCFLILEPYLEPDSDFRADRYAIRSKIIRL